MSSTEVISFIHFNSLIVLCTSPTLSVFPTNQKTIGFQLRVRKTEDCLVSVSILLGYHAHRIPTIRKSFLTKKKKKSFEIKSACVLNYIRYKLSFYFYCKL